MRWKQTLLWSVLLAGCGSFLTLLSCFYAQETRPMYLDAMPIAHRGQRLGFPLPVFSYYVDLWKGNQLVSSVDFVWVGALLDVIFYAAVVGFVLLIGYGIVRWQGSCTSKALVTNSIEK